MTVQNSVAVRNARLIPTKTPSAPAPIMTIRTGAQPVDCAAANSGTVLATLTLPSDWMSAASGGTKTKAGTWQDASADATGTAAHYRIHDSTGTTCHAAGSIGVGTGDLQVDSTSFTAGQSFTITSYTKTAGNA